MLPLGRWKTPGVSEPSLQTRELCAPITGAVYGAHFRIGLLLETERLKSCEETWALIRQGLKMVLVDVVIPTRGETHITCDATINTVRDVEAGEIYALVETVLVEEGTVHRIELSFGCEKDEVEGEVADVRDTTPDLSHLAEEGEGAIFQILKAWRELVNAHESTEGMAPEEVEKVKKKVVEMYSDMDCDITVGDEVVGTIVFQPLI